MLISMGKSGNLMILHVVLNHMPYSQTNPNFGTGTKKNLWIQASSEKVFGVEFTIIWRVFGTFSDSVSVIPRKVVHP